MALPWASRRAKLPLQSAYRESLFLAHNPRASLQLSVRCSFSFRHFVGSRHTVINSAKSPYGVVGHISARCHILPCQHGVQDSHIRSYIRHVTVCGRVSGCGAKRRIFSYPVYEGFALPVSLTKRQASSEPVAMRPDARPSHRPVPAKPKGNASRLPPPMPSTQ